MILWLEVGHILTFFLPHDFVLLLAVIDTRVPLEAFTTICLISMEFNSSADEDVTCFANKFQTFCPSSVSLAGFYPGLSWPSPAYITGFSVCSSCLCSAWNLISFGLPVPSGQGKIFHSLNIFFPFIAPSLSDIVKSPQYVKLVLDERAIYGPFSEDLDIYIVEFNESD